MIGKTLSHYEITALLGKGGMGEVYRARDTHLGREVAIKVLPPELAKEPSRLSRFKREARMLASLQHQNIGTIYGLEEADEVRFLVLELVEGESLDQRLTRGQLTVEESIAIAGQIAAALEAAHSRSVVHRDLKPANVIVKANGEVKVLDFGLARSLDPDSGTDADPGTDETNLTQVGIVLGTLAYMSPEQALGRAVDARSDLFAFGVVLYEMLSGQHPFRNLGGGSLLDSILTSAAPAPSSIRREIPASLDALVAALLAKQPQDRPSSAATVSADLARRDEPTPDSSPTIAVLPFSSLSADPEDEFLADGMADEIINALTKIQSLRVLSRTSSFAFKGRSEDIRDIARALDVSIVLEGSLRRAGKRIRVATQLVNAQDGYHLWSDRYDRDIEDVFVVQDEIAERVAGALRIVLTERESEALQRLPTGNIEAYELYLHGRTMLSQFTEEKLRAAQSLFRRAVDLDEEFLPAWFGLTEASVWIYQWGLNARNDIDLQTAIAASDRAMVIAPHRGEAHAAKGIASWLQDDMVAAVRALERALELDPRLWEAAYFLARVQQSRGEHESAIQHYSRASDIRPDDYQSLSLVCPLLESLGRNEELQRVARQAKQVVERHLSLHPDDVRAYYLGANIQLLLADRDKAKDWARRALELSPTDGGARYNVACLYAKVGELEDALELLEAAVDTGWGFRSWLETDPAMDPLRDLPRFQSVLERIANQG